MGRVSEMYKGGYNNDELPSMVGFVEERIGSPQCEWTSPCYLLADRDLALGEVIRVWAVDKRDGRVLKVVELVAVETNRTKDKWPAALVTAIRDDNTLVNTCKLLHAGVIKGTTFEVGTVSHSTADCSTASSHEDYNRLWVFSTHARMFTNAPFAANQVMAHDLANVDFETAQRMCVQVRDRISHGLLESIVVNFEADGTSAARAKALCEAVRQNSQVLRAGVWANDSITITLSDQGNALWIPQLSELSVTVEPAPWVPYGNFNAPRALTEGEALWIQVHDDVTGARLSGSPLIFQPAPEEVDQAKWPLALANRLKASALGDYLALELDTGDGASTGQWKCAGIPLRVLMSAPLEENNEWVPMLCKADQLDQALSVSEQLANLANLKHSADIEAWLAGYEVEKEIHTDPTDEFLQWENFWVAVELQDARTGHTCYSAALKVNAGLPDTTNTFTKELVDHMRSSGFFGILCQRDHSPTNNTENPNNLWLPKKLGMVGAMHLQPHTTLRSSDRSNNELGILLADSITHTNIEMILTELKKSSKFEEFTKFTDIVTGSSGLIPVKLERLQRLVEFVYYARATYVMYDGGGYDQIADNLEHFTNQDFEHILEGMDHTEIFEDFNNILVAAYQAVSNCAQYDNMNALPLKSNLIKISYLGLVAEKVSLEELDSTIDYSELIALALLMQHAKQIHPAFVCDRFAVLTRQSIQLQLEPETHRAGVRFISAAKPDEESFIFTPPSATSLSLVGAYFTTESPWHQPFRINLKERTNSIASFNPDNTLCVDRCMTLGAHVYDTGGARDNGVDENTGLFHAHYPLATLRALGGNGPELDLTLHYSAVRANEGAMGDGWAFRFSYFDNRRRVLTLSTGQTLTLTRAQMKRLSDDETQVLDQDGYRVTAVKGNQDAWTSLTIQMPAGSEARQEVLELPVIHDRKEAGKAYKSQYKEKLNKVIANLTHWIDNEKITAQQIEDLKSQRETWKTELAGIDREALVLVTSRISSPQGGTLALAWQGIEGHIRLNRITDSGTGTVLLKAEHGLIAARGSSQSTFTLWPDTSECYAVTLDIRNCLLESIKRHPAGQTQAPERYVHFGYDNDAALDRVLTSIAEEDGSLEVVRYRSVSKDSAPRVELHTLVPGAGQQCITHRYDWTGELWVEQLRKQQLGTLGNNAMPFVQTHWTLNGGARVIDSIVEEQPGVSRRTTRFTYPATAPAGDYQHVLLSRPINIEVTTEPLTSNIEVTIKPLISDETEEDEQ